MAHEVDQERDRSHSIEYKGEDGAEEAAVGVVGLGDAHHQRHVQPGGHDDVHDGAGRKMLQRNMDDGILRVSPNKTAGDIA
jgi:hypothetical protein